MSNSEGSKCKSVRIKQYLDLCKVLIDRPEYVVKHFVGPTATSRV